MPTPLDTPSAVRPGEELDVAALAAYLARTVPGLESLRAEDLHVEQFGSGFSNLTYLVRAGEAEWVLRRPPLGVAAGTSAHDVARECRILGALAPAYPKVPRTIACCADPSVLGAPFYVMERVRGTILRGVADGRAVGEAGMRRLADAFVAEMAAIHALDAAGLAGLGRPEGYVARQVSGWSKRWAAARTGDVPDVERAAAWLAERQPPERGASLIHNDFKYDNLVLDPADPGRVLAVLDWEMATVGDPLMDLGTTLGYWVQRDDPPELRALGLGITALPGNPTREALVARYAAATGRDVSDAVFYYVFGLFKLAVVAQQIYARWAKGVTRDPRFGALDASVRALGATAVGAIARGRLDGGG
jgi:aminoglycoside phosphotransferase (APT) family kinase protein